MPVYDKGRTEPEAAQYPDQVCIVLKPFQAKQGDGQIGQSGSLTIETVGMTGYLPIYTNYQQAMKEHPNSHIYVMSLIEFKKELGIPM
tara:strand:- start:263 stop:526 length:264 start_codon:yes stop_codon:yes gene_type:complete